MSWSMYFTGTREGVATKVRESRHYGGDSTQFDAAQAFILSELASIPESKGAKVAASGHHEEYGRNLQISVEAVELHI